MVLTDERWAALAPLLEACRPKGKTPPRDLRQTIGAIVWRHANGARWRAIPAEHGPLGSRARLPPCGTDDRRCRSWWRAAQLFIRWAKLGAWERLLAAAQEGGVELGMAFLDGTSIRAHPKAAGAPKKGEPAPNGTGGKRSDGRAGASAPRRASSPTGEVERSLSRSPPAKRTSCR
jgi:transposase